MKGMKMNKELEIFATTLNEIVKVIPDSFYLNYIQTTNEIENLIENNKNYDYTYDEDGDIQDKIFKGYKDDNLNKVLEKIKKSLEKDEDRRDSDRDSLNRKVFNNLKAVKNIVKVYAINTEEDR